MKSLVGLEDSFVISQPFLWRYYMCSYNRHYCLRCLVCATKALLCIFFHVMITAGHSSPTELEKNSRETGMKSVVSFNMHLLSFIWISRRLIVYLNNFLQRLWGKLYTHSLCIAPSSEFVSEGKERLETFIREAKSIFITGG